LKERDYERKRERVRMNKNRRDQEGAQVMTRRGQRERER